MDGSITKVCIAEAGAGIVHDHCQSLIVTDCLNGFLLRAELRARLSAHAGGVAGALKLLIIATPKPYIQALPNRKPRRRVAGGAHLRIAPHLMNFEEDIDRVFLTVVATLQPRDGSISLLS